MEESKLYEDETYVVTTKRFIIKNGNKVYNVLEVGGGRINVAQSISSGIFFLLLGIGLMSIGNTFFIIVGLLLLGLAIWMFKGDPHYNIYTNDDFEYIARYIPQDVALKLYQNINIAKSRHKNYEEQKLYEELKRM
jgi:hypothetical protein